MGYTFLMREGKREFDVIVIGGGASGMMAAGRSAERGKSVLLIEKNANLGKKLDITGGGRCNITNAEFDKHAFPKNYGVAKDFLYSPLSKFGVQDTFDFFTKRGLPLITEAKNRVFPKTQKATDVTRVLVKYLKDNGVQVLTKSPVIGLRAENGRVVEALTAHGLPVRGTQTGNYSAGSFIIATGGMSHPETGSTGDGLKWLANLGHAVSTPSPTVVPLKVREQWVKSLAGVALQSMKITFFCDGKKSFSKTGPLLFTHFGLSGPLILNCAKAVGELISEGDVTAAIDIFPDLDLGGLEKIILGAQDSNKNKDFKNVLDKVLPNGISRVILKMLALPDPNVKCHSVTKEERKRLVHLVKSIPLTITGLMGYDRAVISDGGVSLKEVDTKTFASLIVKNLYLTGDVLNISRPSGGYSLQLCWTTGYVAGNSI